MLSLSLPPCTYIRHTYISYLYGAVKTKATSSLRIFFFYCFSVAICSHQPAGDGLFSFRGSRFFWIDFGWLFIGLVRCCVRRGGKRRRRRKAKAYKVSFLLFLCTQNEWLYLASYLLCRMLFSCAAPDARWWLVVVMVMAMLMLMLRWFGEVATVSCWLVGLGVPVP